MAIRTTLEQLEAVQDAIQKVEKGQAVSIGGEQLTRANLRTLYEREDQLLNRYRQEQGTGGMAKNHAVRDRSN